MAIATWFILSQWQPTANSVYLLAAVSFAAGLTTDEIVETVIRFTKRVLRDSTTKTEEEGANTGEEEAKSSKHTSIKRPKQNS